MDQTQDVGTSTTANGPNWLAILAAISVGIGACTPWISVSLYDSYNNATISLNYSGTGGDQ